MMIPDDTFISFLKRNLVSDAAHDLSHIKRVVAAALRLSESEDADTEIVRYAAWLHDCVSVAKDSPDRKRASKLAAESGVAFLREQGYSDEEKLDQIFHCIEAHSFSAGIEPESIEASIVQDADRLDALGAIGIARCLITGAGFGASLYHPDEPEPENRPADEKNYIIDHFYEKLLKLEHTMKTEAGREEARRRTTFMREWLNQLFYEAGS
ncbi:MAG: HD domain-containing protein [Balneolia bacterium]|nr:HD domain-containing protein [Balneolia bacterium]